MACLRPNSPCSHCTTELRSFYDPDLKPLLPSDTFEATEGLPPFVVSILVAGWLTIRWWRQTRERQQEHRLSRCIQSLLDIERRQMDLTTRQTPATTARHCQLLLDEVTKLRQEALRELTAHDLNDDRRDRVCQEYCHALSSDKINAKLTRQQFDAVCGNWLNSPPETEFTQPKLRYE